MICLLHLRFEVDQEVAATDQVHLGKGGVGDQVLSRERHGFAHRFADLPGGFVHPREEAGQPFRGDIGGDALGVDAAAGDLQRLFVDIGGEDLQSAGVLRRRLIFEQQHGEGVRLLAGGAAGDPDAQGASASFARMSGAMTSVSRAWKASGSRKNLVTLIKQVAGELLDLVGMFAQVGEVFRDVVEVAQAHAPFQPPREHFLAIAAKIELRAGDAGERAIDSDGPGPRPVPHP